MYGPLFQISWTFFRELLAYTFSFIILIYIIISMKATSKTIFFWGGGVKMWNMCKKLNVVIRHVWSQLKQNFPLLFPSQFQRIFRTGRDDFNQKTDRCPPIVLGEKKNLQGGGVMLMIIRRKTEIEEEEGSKSRSSGPLRGRKQLFSSGYSLKCSS